MRLKYSIIRICQGGGEQAFKILPPKNKKKTIKKKNPLHRCELLEDLGTLNLPAIYFSEGLPSGCHRIINKVQSPGT